MIILAVNPDYRELFRLLYRIKGKREVLSVLFLDGGGSYQGNGLRIRRANYFGLLREGRKTLRDLILEGKLKEYAFSRVIRQAFFVPKLWGDILYYAYLMRGWGQSVEVEGIEEFEERVRKLKKTEKFVDYWDVEEVQIAEEVVVLFDGDRYMPSQLSALFTHMSASKRKTLILASHLEDSPVFRYFSFAGHRMEKIVFRPSQSWQNLKYAYWIDRREELLSVAQDRKLLICEWDMQNLLKWAVFLSMRGIPFGVKGDYRGEKIVLSTVAGVWGHYEVGFFGLSPKANPSLYLRAFHRVREKYFSVEDALILGMFTGSCKLNNRQAP